MTMSPAASIGRPALPDEELLARLIAFDSTSARSNRPIADFVCDYLDAPDTEIVRNESADGEKVNVVALKGPAVGRDRAGLVLSGHLDTVPATEPGWTTDPFTLSKRDGKYYGRGTADMKGFDALAINTMRGVPADALEAPLALVLTYDEEVGSLGARRLVETWPSDRVLPGSAVIGEPTSLRVVRMHKGHLKIRITVHGRPAHSGSPHLGVNAIEPAATLVGRLGALREGFEERRSPMSDFFPEVPYSVLTVARIRGGEALNVVPDRCTVEVGIRLLPGEDPDDAVAAVRSIAEMLGGDVTADVEVLGDNPPLLTEASAPVHATLSEVMDQAGSRGVSFASDGGWLARMGIDCVLWGPGTIEVAHKPDEHLAVEELARARTHLNDLVARLTGARPAERGLGRRGS